MLAAETDACAPRDGRECIVEAENSAEIADCQDTYATTMEAAPDNLKECIVDAENAAEIADCKDSYDPSAEAASEPKSVGLLRKVKNLVRRIF